MKTIQKKLAAMGLLALMIFTFCSVTAFAASGDEPAAPTAAVTAQAETKTAPESATGSKAVAAGICVGFAAAAGAVGMGIAIGKSCEGISRQPEATGQIRTSLMLGLVFIETAIIYSLIIAILIIFVL